MPSTLSARELLGWVDPAELYTAGPSRAAHSFWLDAGPDADSGWSWLGIGEPDPSPPRDRVCDRIGAARAWGPFAGGWVGWLGYDPAAAAAGAPTATVDVDAPAEAGLRVTRFVAVDHSARRLWAVAPADELDDFAAEVARWRGTAEGERTRGVTTLRAATPTEVTARHTPEQYAALIERCRDAIRAGDAYQLCLTTRFAVTASVDPVAAYLRLRRATPAHHGGLIRIGAHALLSASPERFLEIHGGVVQTRPIKGTRPRSDDPAQDAAWAHELRTSRKERAENVMIVDLMRNDLQRVCRPGTVSVRRLLEVESYPAVHQLVSDIAGRLLPQMTLGDVLAATFPAGSMTGAPKLSAMTLLQSLERAPRGVFAGCFGWVGEDGAVDLAMVIRSIVVHPGGAYVGAGGGITWGSDPAAEVAEVGIKAAGPLRAVGAALPAGW